MSNIVNADKLKAFQEVDKKPRKTKSANGAGGIRRRSDGRYEARLVIGYQDNGKPKRISIYGAT